jgi:PAS domain S-box-containing protein
MPTLSLRTKLVFAITGMVVVMVAALETFYVREVVHQNLEEAGQVVDAVAYNVANAAGQPLAVDLGSLRIDLNDPKQVNHIQEQLVQDDDFVASTVEAATAYSPMIYDAAITNTNGYVLAHSAKEMRGRTMERRPDYSSLVNAGLREQLRVVYGPPRVYETRLPLHRQDGSVFGEARVGLITPFLKSTIHEKLRQALVLSAGIIVACLVLSAVVSSLALRPLTAISRRLDLLTSGQVEPTLSLPKRSDEYGAVSNKIERLGRQVRDVKEVFSALKENLDQMMANLQDGVMLFTSDFRAVLVSASSERFIGLSRGEMLGSYPAQIFSHDFPLGHLILEAFNNHTPIGQEEVEAKNGHMVQVALDFIEERGERIGALLTLRDSESVHRIEDEIELSRRLAAIGRLTSGVAHEVKNPINAIVVHLEVLRQKLKEVDPDTRRHMDVIGSEIARLDRVVQTLVDFTRPVDLRLAEMDIQKLVDEVVTLASPAAAQHNVNIERKVTHEPLRARIDADLVKQAVLNIVLNGVQAMPNGGSLRISTRRDTESALITIRDHGAGIPPDIRDKIFNLYFTTKKEGSGIGLAMAYRVVQLHHGSLEFTSIADHGTTFYLRFPLAESNTIEQPRRVRSEDSVSKT